MGNVEKQLHPFQECCKKRGNPLLSNPW